MDSVLIFKILFTQLSLFGATAMLAFFRDNYFKIIEICLAVQCFLIFIVLILFIWST